MKPVVSLGWERAQTAFDLAFRATGSKLSKGSISVAMTTFLCSPCISIRLYNIYFSYRLNKLFETLKSHSTTTDWEKLRLFSSNEQLSILLKLSCKNNKPKREIIDLFPVWFLWELIQLNIFDENAAANIIDCCSDERARELLQYFSPEHLPILLKSSDPAVISKIVNCCPALQLSSSIALKFFSEDEEIIIVNCCSDERTRELFQYLPAQELVKIFRLSNRDAVNKIVNCCSAWKLSMLMQLNYFDENDKTKIIDRCSNEKAQELIHCLSREELSGLLTSSDPAVISKIVNLSPVNRLSELMESNCFSESEEIIIINCCLDKRGRELVNCLSKEKLSKFFKSSNRSFVIKMTDLCYATRVKELIELNYFNESEIIKIIYCCSDAQAKELVFWFSDVMLLNLLTSPYRALRGKIANLCSIQRLSCLIKFNLCNENELTNIVESCSDERAQELLRDFSDIILLRLLTSTNQFFKGRIVNLCLAGRLFTLISQNHFTDHDVQCIINLCSKEKLSELIQFPHWRFSAFVEKTFFDRQRLQLTLLNQLQKHYKSQNLSFQQTLSLFSQENSHFARRDIFNALFFVKMNYIEKIHQKISQRELEDFLQKHANTPLDLNSLLIEQLDWTLPGHSHSVALSGMIRAIQERTPIIGAPPFHNTEKFQTFYQNMENGLRFITYRLIDTHMPLTQDQKEILFHTLTHAARHCATTWGDAINKAVNGICGGSMEIAVTLEEQTMQSVHKLLRNTDNKLLQHYKVLYSHYNAPDMEVHAQQAVQMILHTFHAPEGHPSDFVVESETLIPPRSLQELREDERACSIRDLFTELYSPYTILQAILERMSQDQTFANSIYAQAVELAKRYREEASGNAEPLSSATFMDITCPESAHYSPNPVLIVKLLIDMGILEAYSPAFNGSFGNPESAPAE